VLQREGFELGGVEGSHASRFGSDSVWGITDRLADCPGGGEPKLDWGIGMPQRYAFFFIEPFFPLRGGNVV
jgi:hypothetical protein